MSAVNHWKAKVGALSRSRDDSDPELIEARLNLKAAKLSEHISRTLTTGPALTTAQRYNLAALLTTGGGAR